ncbi:MAG: phosphoribosylglycinamide formyltransferase [Flavobacteriaceae bacterium]|jgi:phosphoribosylglycinamide formyltransferase-1
MASQPKRLILFASGSGTNVQNICEYFQQDDRIQIVLVAGNKEEAYVWERIKPFKIEAYCFTKTDLQEGQVLQKVKKYQPDLIVLAGFLLKIPEAMVAAFPDKIINIHPALLPKYGGKGMYGLQVHKAVKQNKETESGISIHYVNSHYDEGQLLFQARVTLTLEDTPQTIAQKVQALEYKHFPKIIEQLLFDSQQDEE